jgi:hypothetical protein
MENVLVETPQLPPMKAGKLSVSPWILGALSARQGASIDAEEVFGGVLAADYREGDKLKSGERTQSIAVDASGLKLPHLTDFLRDGGMMGLSLQGAMDLSSKIDFDPVFDSQPNGQVNVTIAGFTLPSQTMNFNFNGVPMPIRMPELKLGQTKLNAKVADGQIDIQSLTFTGSNGSITGQAKGRIGMSFSRSNRGVGSSMGDYDLSIDLTVPKDFMAANESSGIGLVLGFLKDYKRDTPQGVRFVFNMKGNPLGLPQLSQQQ